MTTLERAIEMLQKSKGVIRPHVLLSGPTGSGKTYNTNVYALKYGIPIIKVNAAQITKEGYSGASLSKVLVPLSKFGDKPNIVFVDENSSLLL